MLLDPRNPRPSGRGVSIYLFILRNQLDEGIRLSNEFADDDSTEMAYNRSLLLFKKYGDSMESSAALA